MDLRGWKENARLGEAPGTGTEVVYGGMNHMDFSGVYNAMIAIFIASIVAAFAFGGLCVWGLPKLWMLIKPFIHAMTA
jgi:hypothetical protein